MWWSKCGEDSCTLEPLLSLFSSKHVNLSCEVCGKSLTKKSSLDCHIKTRSSLSCSECGQILCNTKFLQMHKKSDHNYAPCEECGGKYLKPLDHHKLWAHNLWPETSVKDNLIASDWVEWDFRGTGYQTNFKWRDRVKFVCIVFFSPFCKYIVN